MRVEDAKVMVRESIHGTGPEIDCPCCGRSATAYSVTLCSSHLRELLKFYSVLCEVANSSALEGSIVGRSIHAADELGARAKSYNEDCLAVLRHWGFVESSKRGWWSMTMDGLMFLFGKKEVTPTVYIWNGEQVRPPSGRDVNVYELGIRKETIENTLNGEPQKKLDLKEAVTA